MSWWETTLQVERLDQEAMSQVSLKDYVMAKLLRERDLEILVCLWMDAMRAWVFVVMEKKNY